MTCPNCNTELSNQSIKCDNCGHESVQEISFFTPQIKKQIIIAVVVFIAAFFGTKYLIAEYKKSKSEKDIITHYVPDVFSFPITLS